MISTVRNSFRASPARTEMKALGITPQLPLVRIALVAMAVLDVTAASIALAGV